MLLGILIPLVFFSISSSKRILYILPFYSLAALLTANLLAGQKEKGSRILNNILLGYVMLFCITLILIRYFLHDYTIPLFFSIAGIAGILIFIYVHNSGLIHPGSRPILMTYLLAVILVVGSSTFMASNELKINSPAPLTDFIQANDLNNRLVLVYNSRQPSIAFELNRSVISLYDGSSALARETQFESDSQWKKYFVDMREETDLTYLKEILQRPAVLITFNEKLPDKRKWMLEHFEHEKRFGKYTVYF